MNTETNIWLVWVTTLSNEEVKSMYLAAVATTETKAKMYSKLVRDQDQRPLRVNIEKRLLDHYFAESFSYGLLLYSQQSSRKK